MSGGRVTNVTLTRVARRGWADLALLISFLYLVRDCFGVAFEMERPVLQKRLVWQQRSALEFKKRLVRMLAGVVFLSSSRPIQGQYQGYDMPTSFQILSNLSVFSHIMI
jgi:hypothetical protein